MQDRWVSYIYRYKEERKCENAGYVKINRTSRNNQNQARIEIGLKLCKPLICRCRIYFIYNERELVLFDQVLVKPEERDTIVLKKTFPWQGFLKETCTPQDYSGILFAVDDGDTLMTNWSDRNVAISNLKSTTEHIDTGTNDPVASQDPMDSQDPVDFKDAIASQDPVDSIEPIDSIDPIDSIEHMLKTSIKLPQFIDSPFSECVKIVPQDIGKLPMSNWKLGQNSFLTHGYYRYKYIMLGKVRFDNKETYVIGVPGVFTNKEKYLANMFGFGLFVPVKKSDTKTGCFGYWVFEVMRQ